MTWCAHCGSSRNWGARFCGRCGQALNSITTDRPHAWQTKTLTPLCPVVSHTLDTIDAQAFEELTRQLFERMGYTARVTKGSHDGGIDIEAFDP